jgi:alpha-amylase
MCTKYFSDGDVHKYFNPYDSPYDSFIAFMNTLKDITIRIKEIVPNVETTRNLLEIHLAERSPLIRGMPLQMSKIPSNKRAVA